MATIINLAKLWQDWDMRIIVLSSLSLQIFLQFSGPLRKRTSRGCVIMLIWLAYILSGVISSYGSVIIFKTLITWEFKNPVITNAPVQAPETPLHLLAMWGSILTLSLGGRDTISAFSLEDNRLWLRKRFNCFLFSVVIWVVIQLALEGHYFSLPPVIILCIGWVRYTDWVNSLTLASKLGTVCSEEPFFMTITDGQIEDDNIELTNLQVLQHAFKFYTHFKGLIDDCNFPFKKCSDSRNFFIMKSPRDAFRIVERELNFFYDVLYTKAWVIKGRSSYYLRIFEIMCLWVTLIDFYLEDKNKFGKRQADIGTTYVLLLGTVFLEASAVIMVLSSDWSITFLLKSFDDSSFSIAKKLKQVAKYLSWYESSWWMKFVNRRWSNSISQYNLINYCLHTCLESFSDTKEGKTTLKVIEGIFYVEKLVFDDDIRDLIFEQLKMKSLIADNEKTAWEMQTIRGEWVLSDEQCNQLLPWVNDLEFDQSVLMWHIATDICFHTDSNDDDDENGSSIGGGNNENLEKARNLSKGLSDYMLYLLINQPDMMSTVAAEGEVMYARICVEVRELFKKKNIKSVKGDKLKGMTEACKSLLSIYSDNNDTSKPTLYNALDLSMKLKILEAPRKWEVLSKVWVEMLCYAAIHCKASAHATQLKQGGQLISFVWLLMVHFALVP